MRRDTIARTHMFRLEQGRTPAGLLSGIEPWASGSRNEPQRATHPIAFVAGMYKDAAPRNSPSRHSIR
jgi:hypothetical protein